MGQIKDIRDGFIRLSIWTCKYKIHFINLWFYFIVIITIYWIIQQYNVNTKRNVYVNVEKNWISACFAVSIYALSVLRITSSLSRLIKFERHKCDIWDTRLQFWYEHLSYNGPSQCRYISRCIIVYIVYRCCF